MTNDKNIQLKKRALLVKEKMPSLTLKVYLDFYPEYKDKKEMHNKISATIQGNRMNEEIIEKLEKIVFHLGIFKIMESDSDKKYSSGKNWNLAE